MLTTERLRLMPLNRGELTLYAEVMEQKVEQAWLKEKMDGTTWNTVWLLFGPEDELVGELFFYGENRKAVEFGAFTFREHREKGYMSEAVEALSQFANCEPRINLWAHVDENNESSQRVLIKNGFSKFGTIWIKKLV
jgi:RimJ/RimL family protein N-acetyltransferase